MVSNQWCDSNQVADKGKPKQNVGQSSRIAWDRRLCYLPEGKATRTKKKDAWVSFVPGEFFWFQQGIFHSVTRKSKNNSILHLIFFLPPHSPPTNKTENVHFLVVALLTRIHTGNRNFPNAASCSFCHVLAFAPSKNLGSSEMEPETWNKRTHNLRGQLKRKSTLVSHWRCLLLRICKTDHNVRNTASELLTSSENKKGFVSQKDKVRKHQTVSSLWTAPLLQNIFWRAIPIDLATPFNAQNIPFQRHLVHETSLLPFVSWKTFNLHWPPYQCWTHLSALSSRSHPTRTTSSTLLLLFVLGGGTYRGK